MDLKAISFMFLASFYLVSCSEVLVGPDLHVTEVAKRTNKNKYKIIEKTLSASEIADQNETKFETKVKFFDQKNNRQKIITLSEFSREVLPQDRFREHYVLGPGDIISISRSGRDFASNTNLKSTPFFSESLKIDPAGFVTTIDGFKLKVAGLRIHELVNFLETSLRFEEYLYEDQVLEKPFPVIIKESYRLGAGDMIEITRLQDIVDPETGHRHQQPLSYELLIEQDGSVQFIELDGRIKLSEQTLAEAQDTITQELLRSGLATPVTVNIKKYESQTISITGEFGPEIAALRPGFNTAGRVILSYLSRQIENVGRLNDNYDNYLVKLSRGKEHFQLRLSELLKRSEKDQFILLHDDHLELVKIMKSPNIKAEVEHFSSSYITLTQDSPFKKVDTARFSHDVSGSQKTLRIFLNNRNLSIYDILSEFGYWPEDGSDNLLLLTRGNKRFRFSSNAIIDRGPKKSYPLKAGDIIKVNRSINIGDKVYVFGEVGAAKAITVSNKNRPYLSEVLEKSGVFNNKEADVRHIYVLRQKSLGEFNAFRFDVSDVVNFHFVEKLEMRPSDIVLVRTLPLYRFNRFINAVFGIGGNALNSIKEVVDQIGN